MALFPGIGHQLSIGTGEDNDYYLKHFEGRCECWMHFHGLWGFTDTGQTGIPSYSDIICGMRACLGLLKFAEGDGKLQRRILLLYTRKIKSTFIEIFPIMKQRVPVTVLPRLPQMPPMMIMCSGSEHSLYVDADLNTERKHRIAIHLLRFFRYKKAGSDPWSPDRKRPIIRICYYKQISRGTRINKNHIFNKNLNPLKALPS